MTNTSSHLSQFILILCWLLWATQAGKHPTGISVADRTNSTLYTPPTSYTTYLCDGVPISSTDGSACVSGKLSSVTTGALGAIGSLQKLVQSGTRDDYAYRPGYYFDSTGCVKTKSVFDCVKRGTTVDLYSEFSGFNSIILNSGASYTLTDAAVEDFTLADGSDTCDFSGLGAGIAVFGGTKLSITDTSVYMWGVAKSAVFVDSGSIVTVQNCKLRSYGGTLYSDYINTMDDSYMISPPWVLGIMGSSRAVVLLGDRPTMHVIDSDVAAAQWAVLSQYCTSGSGLPPAAA
ncbi:hypothetical protein Pelo_18858 [Pelomyxa schiedti]|nr:hypothetical protein Pelo_18858 [Pelomyxa schiedti]